MKELFAMGLCAAVSLIPVVMQGENYEYPARNKSLQLNGEILKNAGPRTLTVRFPAKLADGTRSIIPVRLPQNGNVIISTSRGQERLTLTRSGEEIQWQHFSVDGSVPNRRFLPNDPSPALGSYWWENTAYAPNGRYKQTFSVSKLLLDWNAYFQSKFRVNLSEAFFPVAVEVENGRIRWYLNDILLQEQPVLPDVYDAQLKIAFSPGVELGKPSVQKLKAVSAGFHLLNLAARCNAQGDALKQEPGRFEKDGIPFEIMPPNRFGMNCVDLGFSWYREGNSTGYEEPNQGAFGGRWGGALSGNHTRIQFRLPHRNYNMIYLLAACDKRPDRSTDLTAQFYRPGSGFPQNSVPLEPVKADGKLHLIRIPVDVEKLRELSDREVIELELTGKIHLFRAYPDPNYYSWHGAGLPSGVKVYAATLGIDPVKVDFLPETYGAVWVEESPAFRLKLTNSEPKPVKAEIRIDTESYDKQEKHSVKLDVTIPAQGVCERRFDLPVEKYGWHAVNLTVNGVPYKESLVKLRNRSYAPRKFTDRGFLFGTWPPGNSPSHGLGSIPTSIRLCGPLGINTFAHTAWRIDNELLMPLVRQYGLKNYMTAKIGSFTKQVDLPNIEQALRDARIAPSKINEPTFQFLFAEPGGIGSGGCWPEMYGEPPYKRTPAQEAKFQDYKRIIRNYGTAFRKLFPEQKLLMPWGDSSFTLPFLEDPEMCQFIDGFGLDIGFFDRVPEQQFHGSSIHRLYQFHRIWKKYKKTPPLIVPCEGPGIGGAKDGALTMEQLTSHKVRILLLLSAYGIRHFFSNISGGSDALSYWGEQHYSGGVRRRILQSPYPVYAAQGTLIRHLQFMEFVKWIPTGSLSTYCLEYKDVRNGKLLHVLWTVRGKRPVKMNFTDAFDTMDNPVKELVITQHPLYVYGSDGKLELGEPDHSDSRLGKDHIKLGEVKDLFVKQDECPDPEYLLSSPGSIRRFYSPMELKKTRAGLQVILPPQKKDRGVMPFYTALLPEKPIVIPGKAKYLSMEVTAASDWGRVVYVLRDAKGEQWISVGTRKDYNCDDTKGLSHFNFDGKRLLRFEMPSHLAWDHFREYGTTWWGSSNGDRIVDLPLTLERIYVERRPKAMYVNSLEPVADPAVTLGTLYAEYDSPAEMKDRTEPTMPLPPVTAKLFNPIAELAQSGTLPATEIDKVEDPNHYYDGTRGVFHIRPVRGAVSYDIWLSRSEDGAGALKLGSGLKKAKSQVNGFVADTDFYAFVVYHDRNGEHSAPSKAFKFRMQNKFENR
ncbi:MAG: hypothetical protein IJS14_14930 [Lentisphaeria bacterium]|nr:hypothetical protein [Lentisphaeria bacterium]